MSNSSIIKRSLSIILVLSGGLGLVGLVVLFPGPYVFVFVAIGVLLLGIAFIRSVSDQDRIERKYLLKQLVSQSDFVIEDNSYRAATGKYRNHHAKFELISRLNSQWDVYDMQLTLSIHNQTGVQMMLQEREVKKENEDDKFRLRFNVAVIPDSLDEVLFTDITLRQSLLQVDRGIELILQENSMWLRQPLNEEIDYILHLFDLLCQISKKIEQAK